MTKKHFEVIATALAKARPPELNPSDKAGRLIAKARDIQWQIDIKHVCRALKGINPRFDEDRFTDWINDMGRGRPGK